MFPLIFFFIVFLFHFRLLVCAISAAKVNRSPSELTTQHVRKTVHHANADGLLDDEARARRRLAVGAHPHRGHHRDPRVRVALRDAVQVQGFLTGTAGLDSAHVLARTGATWMRGRHGSRPQVRQHPHWRSHTPVLPASARIHREVLEVSTV